MDGVSDPDLSALEAHLNALLVQLGELETARPKMRRAIDRARVGQEIDRIIVRIGELQVEIAGAPASTLNDAAVQLRRLAAYINPHDKAPTRLLTSALAAVE